RLVEAALAARGPERSLGRSVHHVRVARVDQDLAEVLGFLEPHALPRLAGVSGLVNAVAEVRAALARILARPEPDDARVLRVDDNAAERERPAVVEDRRKRRSAVGGFPQSPECRGDIPGIRRLRIDRDVLYAARLDSGPDAAERESFQNLGRQPI